MNIDPEFVKTTTEFIDKTLEAYKAAGVSPTVGDIWDCENVGDFLCGFFVGELVGSILSACLLYTSPSPRDRSLSRMPSSA